MQNQTAARQTFKSEFALGDRVYIDDSADIEMLVTGVCYKLTGELTAELQWMHNGTLQTAWVSPLRLTRA